MIIKELLETMMMYDNKSLKIVNISNFLPIIRHHIIIPSKSFVGIYNNEVIRTVLVKYECYLRRTNHKLLLLVAKRH